MDIDELKRIDHIMINYLQYDSIFYDIRGFIVAQNASKQNREDRRKA